MFKGILPSHKRVASTEFTMVTGLGDSMPNGKENKPQGNYLAPSKGRPPIASAKSYGQPVEKEKKKRLEKKQTTVAQEQHPAEMNQDFDKLLDDLQIPSNLRPKLIGMDATVKAAMLKSSHILKPPPSVSPPMTPRTATLRRTRSIDSISSPRRPESAMDTDVLQPPRPNFVYGSAYAESGSPRGSHSRGSSFDLTKHFSRSQVNLATSSSLDLSGLGSKSGKEKAPNKNLTPGKFFNILSGTSSTQIEVETIKKLCLLLRNESAAWSQEFLSLGGYNALLTRLNEILEVEWREEQHDDKALHELLRCLKALSTSSIGCFALRSSCPTPFVQLMSLLYSDKKPGDVATRQLMVDLLLILFDLYPPSSLPAMSGAPRREAWDSTADLAQSNVITLPAPHRNIFSLIRALLLTPAPPPSESPASPISPHAFIENLHKPRIYKTYLLELSAVCRDYFWVFCHPNNTIWILHEVDEGKVEKPRAPGGMTGGVEFEAMGYFTTHLRLINALSKCVEDLNLPKDHEHSAYRFHMDMFLSGIERIIAISRKASSVYYPNLHLELSRYIAFVGRSGFEIPWTISRLIGLPPASLCKNPTVAARSSGSSSGRSTPQSSKRSTPPMPGSPSRRQHEKSD